MSIVQVIINEDGEQSANFHFGMLSKEETDDLVGEINRRLKTFQTR